jgi:hypothetical protein
MLPDSCGVLETDSAALFRNACYMNMPQVAPLRNSRQLASIGFDERCTSVMV